MAIVYATGERVGAGANTRPMGNVVDGNIRVKAITYTVPAGGLPIGDIIVWTGLPRGARILPQSTLVNAAGAASSTINLGDVGSPTRYLPATSMAAATTTTINTNAASGGYTVTGSNDGELRSVVAGAALQAGQTITLYAHFVQ